MASSQKNIAPEPIDLIVLLNRFIKALKKFWILILLLGLLFSCVSYLRQRRGFVPMYECSAIFSVGSSYSSDDIFSSSFSYDILTAQQVASTFPYLLNTDYMRDMIVVQLEDGYINGSISASAISSTNMVDLTVRSSDPQDAYDILNAVINCYPTAAVYMVDNPVLYIREEPVLPTAPINTFSPGNAIIKGAAAGLGLGLLIAAGFALLTRTVHNADELKKIISLPVLATFPQISLKKRRTNVYAFINGTSEPLFTEALRSLRTKVRRNLEQKNGQVVLLTSTVPGEGKTTISTNLAMSLASEGHRVVLVDADLRKQTISRIFRSGQSSAGLMELLTDPSVTIDQCLKEVSGSTLRYISGPSTQKQHYNLDVRQLHRVLGTLSARFDYVVIDTSPSSIVSDASLLSRYADIVLYVVKADCANRSQILDAISMLHQKDAPLTGCILNGTAARHHRYGYGYGYGSKYRSK